MTHQEVGNWRMSINSIDDYLLYLNIYDETLDKFQMRNLGHTLYFKTPEDRLEFILTYG